jgi:hypothetical protein
MSHPNLRDPDAPTFASLQADDRKAARLLLRAMRGLPADCTVQFSSFMKGPPFVMVFQDGKRIFEAGGGLTEVEVLQHFARFVRKTYA